MVRQSEEMTKRHEPHPVLGSSRCAHTKPVAVSIHAIEVKIALT